MQPGRPQPSRRPPARPPADQGAAQRPAPLLRAREALRPRRRPPDPRARRTSRSCTATASGRCTSSASSSTSPSAAAPRPSAAPAQERMQAIIDNSPALVDRQGPRAALPARQPPLGGDLRASRRRRRSATPPPRCSADRSPAHGRPRPRGARAPAACTRAWRRCRGDDGEEITFLVVKFPLRDADGQIYAVCTIATDITERRRRPRSAPSSRQRLAQAQRLESVGQLAGGVAHDFNNLLSVILTCVGFAQRELPDDHPVRDDVEEIGRAADRAAALDAPAADVQPPRGRHAAGRRRRRARARPRAAAEPHARPSASRCGSRAGRTSLPVLDRPLRSSSRCS